MRAADVDPTDGMRVLRVHPDAVLAPGEPSAFDSAGVGPACAISVGGQILLYYTGMKLRADVPYQMAIGLAISEDGLTFRRLSQEPILPFATAAPFASTPHVRWIGDRLEMWFVNGRGWRPSGAILEPIYDLHRTWSSDGVAWHASEPALELPDASVEGLTRPWIVARDGREHLWFSRRGQEFRRGGADAYGLYELALTLDGRIGPAGPRPVPWLPSRRASDWDSWMQAYGCIVPHNDGLAMFYNGNDFGRGGFGWASLEG